MPQIAAKAVMPDAWSFLQEVEQAQARK